MAHTDGQREARNLEHDRSVQMRWGSRYYPNTLAHGFESDNESTPTTPVELDNPQWAAWRKPKSSFIFYASRDGKGRLLLQHQDGGQVLVPWPVAFEGWDEAMPATIGTPDLDLAGYRLVHEVNAMIYLARISDGGIKTFSKWIEVPGASWR